MSKFGIVCGVLLVYCFAGISSLKCNMCIGSTTSDCAKNVQSSMVVQTCMDTSRFGPPRPGWHPRAGVTTPLPPMISEEDNDVSTEQSEPVSASVDDFAENSDGEEMNSTESFEHHHHHHHHGPHHHHHHHHRRPKLEASCAYVKLKPETSNSTGFVDRACVYMPPKVDLCSFLKKKLKNLDACKTCNSDRCN